MSKIAEFEKYGKVDEKMLIIGMGVVGRSILPLIIRHIDIPLESIVVIDKDIQGKDICDLYGVSFIQEEITESNYSKVLAREVKNGDILVQVAMNISSYSMMKYCREHNIRYIDTSVETWDTLCFSDSLSTKEDCDYYERKYVLDLKSDNRKISPTAVSSCGANPGVVSFFVKQAILNIAKDVGMDVSPPSTQLEWAKLMESLGIKTIHVSEKDTQKSSLERSPGEFINTWCVESYYNESILPAEFSWGSHEKEIPENCLTHGKYAPEIIHMLEHGFNMPIKSWVPTTGSLDGSLICHTESFSMAEYYTLYNEDGSIKYRPTFCFAYCASDDAKASLKEMLANNFCKPNSVRIMTDDIKKGGYDEVGVLLMGHSKNAYWLGSTLTVDEARKISKDINATSLQVAAGLLTGIVHLIDHPWMGVVEADQIDFKHALEIAMPYIGTFHGEYTNWHPLDNGECKVCFSNSDECCCFKNFSN